MMMMLRLFQAAKNGGWIEVYGLSVCVLQHEDAVQ
jgi:hypothetical protein